MKSITELSKNLHSLSKKDRDLFSRIFDLRDEVGSLRIPEKMKPWTRKTFGSVKNVENQRIVRVDNKITFETALYNELRSKRPVQAKHSVDLKKIVKESENEHFCNPRTDTPEDPFGRIRGRKCLTASNVAKFDSSHGLVIFDEHNPLKFSAADIKDYLETAEKWIWKANRLNKKNNYPYIIWNCLWKAAASIIHGHMQITVGQGRHYGEIELLRSVAESYLNSYGTDYFDDWFLIHEKLGLGLRMGKSRVFVNLAARKEKEVVIITGSLKKAYKPIYKVLKAYLGMGVESFNMGIYLSPINNLWEMPVIIRLVDRMSLEVKSSDIGSVEMFARARVIASDPYKVMEKLKKN